MCHRERERDLEREKKGEGAENSQGVGGVGRETNKRRL